MEAYEACVGKVFFLRVSKRGNWLKMDLTMATEITLQRSLALLALLGVVYVRTFS